MMAEALGRWLRDEMELPPSAVPSPAALRRLCSGPGAPIWDFVARHVRSLPNAKKIRGNLRRYREPQGALRQEVARLRKEVQELEDAIGSAQEAAQHLEASLEARQSRWWAELRLGAELRLLGAEPSPEGLRGGHQGALTGPPQRPGQSRAELSASLASGAVPEVLVSISALCQAREAELNWPRPPRKPQEKLLPPQDWLEKAEAVLIGHSPEAVLWALETLANRSTRALLDGPAPSAEAPPTLRRLIQECWGAVGGVWAALAPLGARLARLRGRLEELQPRLGREPQAQRAARLALARAGLGGFWGALSRGVQGLRGDPPKSPKPDPKPDPDPALGGLRRRLRRGRGRALRQQQRLRFLSATARGRRAGLRPLQEQVLGVARAGPGSALAPLVGEGRRRRLALGAPLPHPHPHPPGGAAAPPPLRELSRELGTAGEQLQQGALLRRAALLRLRLRQGALRARRGAGPEPAPPLPPPPLPGGGAELLPQLRLVSAGCRQRIRDWPRLQELLGQWWTQPAQWLLATPPGRTPFSHWLQRWRNAARALGATPTPGLATPIQLGATPTPGLATPSHLEATPIHLEATPIHLEATPTPEEEGEEAPPP